MQVLDRQRLIHGFSGAGRLAWMVTHPTAHAGEGVILFKQLERFPILAFLCQGDKPLGTDVSRAGHPAGGCPLFRDGEGTRNGLCVLFVNGFALG